MFHPIFPPPLFRKTPHSWRLTALHEKLREFGAVHPIDLLDLDDDDVASLELKKLEMKRWTSAMEDLRQAAARDGPPPSPLGGRMQPASSPTASPIKLHHSPNSGAFGVLPCQVRS